MSLMEGYSMSYEQNGQNTNPYGGSDNPQDGGLYGNASYNTSAYGDIAYSSGPVPPSGTEPTINNENGNTVGTSWNGTDDRYQNPYYSSYSNGQTSYNQSYAYEIKPQTTSKFAVACLVLGILGFLTGIFLVGLILDVIAVILGIVSLSTGRPGKGMAVSGIVLSILSILLTLLIYFIVGVATTSSISSTDISRSSTSEEYLNLTSSQLMENVSYETYEIAEGVLIMYENSNDVDVDLDADVVFYNTDGSILSVENGYIWGCAANGKAVVEVPAPTNDNYDPLPYDHYDIAITATAVDTAYTAPNYSNEFDIQSSPDASGTVYATISNPTGLTFDSVDLACIYYADGEVIGISFDYLYDIGKSGEAEFLGPHDVEYRALPYDDYEIIVNNTYYYDY